MKISLRVLGLLVYDFCYPDALRVRKVNNSLIPINAMSDVSSRKKRIFIDMSVISINDAGTGIQRVVKEIAFLFSNIDESKKIDVFFVSASGKRPYQCIQWPYSEKSNNKELVPFEAQPGDVFLGLDYSLDTVRRHRKQLEAFRHNGGKIWFLVHDILPIQFPQWFSRKMVVRYRIWMDIIVSLSSGFFCNSDQTKDDLKTHIEKRYGIYERFSFPVLPMGFSFDVKSRIESKKSTSDIPDNFILMVGTIEPRKGYADIIRAFTELLKRNDLYKLIIIGRKGWKVNKTIKEIISNKFYKKKIFWFDNISDSELSVFYRRCKGLIMASYAEGFGLPLIEALSYEKPVLARDIPVFKYHEKHGVKFFPDTSDQYVIMNSIMQWLNDINCGNIVVRKPDNNWNDAYLKIIKTIS